MIHDLSSGVLKGLSLKFQYSRSHKLDLEQVICFKHIKSKSDFISIAPMDKKGILWHVELV